MALTKSGDPHATPPHNYASYPSLVDRSVFITGGADGIGAGMVEEFVAQGSRVGFADIQAERGAQLVEKLAATNPKHAPIFYEIDLTDIDALQAGLERAQTDLDGIEVLVNNAASDDRHTWEEVTADYWDDRLNVNLRHYFFAIQAVAPHML